MLTSHIIVIVFGLILGIVHYYSEEILHKVLKHKTRIISFGAGVSIAYLFLILLPELYQGVQHIQKLLFIEILIGFILFYVLEQYIYSHAKREQILMELKESHSITFFLYHFVLGIVIARISDNLMAGVLFFLPMLFYTIFTEESLSALHESITERKLVKLFLSGSTFFGILFEITTTLPTAIYYSLISFLAGALLFIIIRESIPKEKKGLPTYFILGAFAYVLIILAYWYISSTVF